MFSGREQEQLHMVIHKVDKNDSSTWTKCEIGMVVDFCGTTWMNMSCVVSESEEEIEVPDNLNNQQKRWYTRFARWYSKRKQHLRPGRLTHHPQNSAEIMYLRFLEHYDKKVGPRDCSEEEVTFIAETFAWQYRNHKANSHLHRSIPRA